MKDYYRILQVRSEAEAETIQAAYRSLMRRVHPDKNPGKREWAENRTRELNEAFGALGDPEKRAAYDRKRGQTPSNGGDAGESSEELREARLQNMKLRQRIDQLTAEAERSERRIQTIERELATAKAHIALLERPERPGGVRSPAPAPQQDSNAAEALRIELPGGLVTMSFARIPSGRFRMGSETGGENEKPPREVYLDGYWIGTEPVTCRQFSAFVKANPAWSKIAVNENRHTDYLKLFSADRCAYGEEKHPVTYVPWSAAAAFAEWAGMRLPTEAQWERAARGGMEGEYGGGKDYLTAGAANYGGSRGGVRPNRSYDPNPFGLYDMLGNVWEWCADIYDDAFYASPEAAQRNPVNLRKPTGTERRVIRGGSWQSRSNDLRVAARGYMEAGSATNACGFRCIMSDSAAAAKGAYG